MKHAVIETRSAEPLETRNDENAPEGLEAATQAVEEMRAAFDERMSGFDEFEARLSEVETRSQRPTTQTAAEDESSAERRAFETYLRPGSSLSPDETRALNEADDVQGGYLTPPEMSTEFIRDLTEISPIRAVASVRNISASSVKYPKRTGITNAKWEGELEESEESTVTFGQLEITAHKLVTYVDLSNEQLADSGGTAEAEVRLALSEDYGKKEGLAFISGSGVKQPEGLLTNKEITEYKNGHATDLKADALIKSMYDLPAMYRNNGSWLMNGTTLGIVRTLKDGDGRFLWQPSFQAGQPSTLLGRPVIEAIDMPDIAAASTPIMFGDFSAYRIVDRLAMSILVNPYSLATKGVTRIHATRRSGGKVMQPARFRKFKMAV